MVVLARGCRGKPSEEVLPSPKLKQLDLFTNLEYLDLRDKSIDILCLRTSHTVYKLFLI